MKRCIQTFQSAQSLRIQLEYCGAAVAQYRPIRFPGLGRLLFLGHEIRTVTLVAGEGGSMRSGLRVVSSVGGVLLAFQGFILAQSATSSLRGTISDAKGLVVAGASVTLSNAATGFSRTAQNRRPGTLSVPRASSATYVLTVSAGFATTKRENVVLQVSSPPR